MGGKRRRVTCSAHLLEHARTAFPPGGSADGTPSFEHFSNGPLAAATEFFRRRFDDAAEPYPGIRAWITIRLPIFMPMVFYAALVDDHVELIDFSEHEDPDYWDDDST